MSVAEILNGVALYAFVIIGILTVFVLATIFFIKSWRRAVELNIPKDKLKQIIKSSIIFTIVPSLAIVIALFSLASVLGIPLSWFRLSVVGSLAYELLAAEMTVSAVGYESLSQFIGTDDISLIPTVLYVMGFSIIGGIVFMIFFGKKVQTSMIDYQQKNKEWGTLAMSYFMLCIGIVFLPIEATKSLPHLLTLITSGLVCYIHLFIIKKFNVKWLGDFVLANSLILAMVSAVFWDKLF